ncbi:single-stranded-DNA-specific exonuclease RecJ [Candidatus Ferrigenium straubiae]|jgi:single-stranded-DNA-specific exonuclease|uniref:single-stranded-DNA-specific exonuclease RecJ n=1 Tax=Candidatus Ferrigenium straubiae TaxID=2919506 RepID=UPI003F4AB81F
MPKITPRSIPPSALQRLLDSGYTPALARIFAARGIADSGQLDTSLAGLLPFDSLKGAREMARLLADAIAAHKKILVIADYDADGATACAVAVRGLRGFGAQVDFIVPNRFEYGYGLTPEIVHLAVQLPLRYGTDKPSDSGETAKQLLPQSAGCAITSDLASVVGSPSRMASSSTSNVLQLPPDILLTVDNGIASVEGVAEANRLGMQVFVTDHHLPGDTLPDAACIVNPNQLGCAFPSKHLAGVGVMFYVLLALRAELRTRGLITEEQGRKLLELLDLVALGTVADVVKLDRNNHILVQQGLRRICAGRACAGINALLQVAGKRAEKISSQDLGFTVGPRLNAAGRLDDMSLGIACLLADDDAAAMQIAARLDALNRERRSIEADMQDSALVALEQVDVSGNFSLALFDEAWHQGVIGILASRLKDRFHRPVIAFARANDGELKGSGRSIAGLHLRDALDLVSKRHPSLIRKFGGHAAAAGLSIAETDFANFAAAFEQVAAELLDESDLAQRIETDGALEHAEMSLDVARLLDEQVWGQGFPAPQFNDDFAVQNQRVVGERHLKLHLKKEGKTIEAILFGHNEPLPEQIHAVYSLSVNEYNGSQSLQLIIRHWHARE